MELSEKTTESDEQAEKQADNSDVSTEIPEGLSVEDAFDQLQHILERMDAEGVSLEESFRCYERGMKLIRYCNETIDRVEKKVRVLSAEGESYEF